MNGVQGLTHLWVSLGLAAALVLLVVPGSLFSASPAPMPWVLVVMGLIGGVAWSFPLAAGLPLGVLLAVVVLSDGEPGWAALALAVPVAAAACRSRWRVGVGLAVVYVGVLLYGFLSTERTVAETFLVVDFWLLFFVAAVAAGRVVRWWLERLERERRRQAEIQTAERRALARDLHDTIVYATTTMVMTAEGSLARAELDQSTRADLEVIAATGRQATADLRSLLSLLRQSGDVTTAIDSVVPGGLARMVDRQVGKLRSAGFDAQAHVAGDLDVLPPSAVKVLMGVLTEGASNVTKHGSRAAPASLMLEVGDAAVDLAIVNRVGQGCPEADHEPLGLVGMSERVREAGGTISAEATGEVFVVQVSLPV